MSRQPEELTTLGLLGLIPFVFGAAAVWLSPLLIPQWVALNIHTIVLTYSGIIAAYMAGMGAGAALNGAPPASPLPGMIAALAACFAILHGGILTFSASATQRYLIMIAVYVYLLLRDLRAAGDFPSWYGALRTRLTFWACVSLTIIMARLVSWYY